MKLVIFLGALIIFISCFFMFFTFDTMLRSKFVCNFDERVSCNITELNFTIIFGIMVVGGFLFIDTMVVYIMLKTWVPGLFVYQPK